MSHRVNYIDLYPSINAAQGQVGPFMLGMDSVAFCRLVSAACFLINNVYNPNSRNYTDPKNADRFIPIDTSYLTSNADVPLIQHAGVNPDTFMYTQLEILQRYVEFKNSGALVMVGEEHLCVNVYLALYHEHNYNVMWIEREHAENGKEWGRAMRNQRETPFDAVADWPTKFDFNPGPLPELLVLPSRRPGYYD